jgi:FMN phosphatase YigB (HAD superfamily)
LTRYLERGATIRFVSEVLLETPAGWGLASMQEVATGTEIRNAVFDLGGVLVDWDPVRIAASVFPDTATRRLVIEQIFLHEDWRAFDREVLSEENAVIRFSERTGLARTEVRRLLAVYLQSLTALPQSVELLKELCSGNLKLYCLSNVNSAVYSFLRKTCTFWHMFEGIVISVRWVLPSQTPASISFCCQGIR